MPKIVFIDVDGTLVDYSNRVPASAVDAIRRARSAGHLVYLATGRSRAEVYDELWAIGVDGLIGGNGAYVEHRGTVVVHRTLSLAECREIVEWLRGRGLEFYLEANAGLFGSEGFAAAALPAIRAYAAGKGAADAATWTVEQAFPDMIFGADLVRADVNKVSFLLDGPADLDAAAAAFPALARGSWGGRGAAALFGDLGVAGIDKAWGIERLLAHLGADRADTIAIGDAAVDLPMMAFCAVGVAMGNAPEAVRRAADHVTGDVEADGLAEAFAALGLVT
ncbi:MAG: HAD family hydrolase [Arachnia sp.]